MGRLLTLHLVWTKSLAHSPLISLCPILPCLWDPVGGGGGDPHQLQPALPHIVELKCPLIRLPQCPDEDHYGFEHYVEQLTQRLKLSRDGVFAALMKKIYLDSALLSSVLKSPDKGVCVIFTVFHFQETGLLTDEWHITSKPQYSHNNKHNLHPTDIVTLAFTKIIRY